MQTVASLYNSLPPEEKSQTGILANYSEVGAISIYGPIYGLPQAIGGENSDWFRGYGDPPPQTLIVVGLTGDQVIGHFDSCVIAGHVTNRYGMMNEETMYRADIFVCRGLQEPWSEFWKHIQSFG